MMWQIRQNDVSESLNAWDWLILALSTDVGIPVSRRVS
jgi:hypothetical protein